MAKFSSNSLLLFRRAYTVAAESTKSQPMAVAAMRKVVVDQGNQSKVAKGMHKDEFWMRDPKTGNWIPESHFGEVDVVDMRKNLLSKKSEF